MISNRALSRIFSCIKTGWKTIKPLEKVCLWCLAIVFTLSNGGFLTPTEVSAAINEEINYQAKLTDSSGDAVSDASYSITFSLYTAASGGTAIWDETQSVTTSDGLFSVMLGSSTSLSAINFNQTLYLGVKVGADLEMTPRKKLGAVPAAFYSNDSDQLDGADSTDFLSATTTNATATITGLNVTRSTTTQATTTNLYVSTLAKTAGLIVSGNATTTGTHNIGTLTLDNALGVTYGGTGLTTAPSYGQVLLGNASSGYTLTATSSLGIALSDTSGTLSIARGGTNATSQTTNGVTYYDGSSITSGSSLTWDGSLLSVTGNASTTQISSTGFSYFATGGGNVGIGDSNPTYKLDVNSSTEDVVARFSSSDANARLVLTDSVDSVFLTNASGKTTLGVSPTASSSNLNITSDGYVGIGTANPTNFLTVKGADTSASTYSILQYDSSVNTVFRSTNSGRIDVMNHNGDGGVMTLTNEATAVNDMTAGHYAFVAKNDAGNRNTVAYMLGRVSDITAASMNSELEFTIMNNLDTSDGSYYQPHVKMFYRGSGLTLQENDAGGNAVQLLTNSDHGDFRLLSGNSPTVHIDGSTGDTYFNGGGDVGIGTDSPGRTLDVVGTTLPLRIRSSNSDYLQSDTGITYTTTQTSANTQLKLVDQDSASGRAIFHAQGNSGAIDALWVGADGNLGIGTSTPGVKLDIVGSHGTKPSAVTGTLLTLSNTNSTLNDTYASIISGNASEAGIYLGDQNDVDIGGIIYDHSSNLLGFRTNNTSNQMVINSSGNVGIGTTTPSSKLDVNGTLTVSGGGVGGSGYGAININDNGATGLSSIFGTSAGLALSGFANTVNQADLFIASGGNVGIGTNDPNYSLEVNGSASTTNLYLPNTTNSSTGVIYKGADRFIHNFYGTGSATGDNTFIGINAGNFTMGGAVANQGSLNTAIGQGAGASLTTANWSTFVGRGAGGSVTEGVQNTAIGGSALGSVTVANQSTAVGYAALSQATGAQNVSLGGNSGRSITSGAQNIFIGYNSGYDGSSQKVDAGNSIAIGYNTHTTASNQVVLGNTSITETLLRGNVGIGTTTPESRLDVKASGTGANSGIRLMALSSDNSVMRLWDAGSDDGRLQLLDGGVGRVLLNSNGDTYFNGGNVGVGSTTPYAKLSVTNTGSDPSFLVEDATSPDSTPFIIDASGKVGIGTASPAHDLHVYNGGDTTVTIGPDGGGVANHSYLEVFGGSNRHAQILLKSGATSGWDIRTNSNTYIAGFSTGGDLVIERDDYAGDILLLPEGGNVGVGTSTPGSILSLGSVANFTTATSTFYGNGINLTNGCFAIGGSCVSGGGGGSTSPAGSNGQIQFNNSGSFGATTSIHWYEGNGVELFSVATTSSYSRSGIYTKGINNAIVDTSSSIITSASDTYISSGATITSAGNGADTYISVAGALSAGDAGDVYLATGGTKFTQPSDGESGNVYIGRNSSDSTNDGNLFVYGNTNVMFKVAATTNGVCHSGADVDGTNTSNTYTLVACNNGAGDIAEFYPADSNVEAGDIVYLSGEEISYDAVGGDPYTGQIKDLGNQRLAVTKKANSSHTPFGVVSTGPFQTFGKDVLKARGESGAKPIALSGRVPVKVTGENGSIKPGDRIVLSSTSGHGMKATESGQTVGIALESFSGKTKDDIGKVMMYVNLSYARLSDSVVAGDVDEDFWTVDQNTGEITALNSLNLNGKSIKNIKSLSGLANVWSIDENGLLKVDKIITNDLTVENGITTRDQETGEYYCLFISGGEFEKTLGRCEDLEGNVFEDDSENIESENEGQDSGEDEEGGDDTEEETGEENNSVDPSTENDLLEGEGESADDDLATEDDISEEGQKEVEESADDLAEESSGSEDEQGLSEEEGESDGVEKENENVEQSSSAENEATENEVESPSLETE